MNPQPVLEVDSDGRITYYNQAAMKALGETGQVADLKKFLPGDLPEIFAIAKQTGEKSFQREVVVNSAVFLENLSFAEPSDAARLYAFDITDRQHIEAALRRAKEEWERTFDAVPDLICHPGPGAPDSQVQPRHGRGPGVGARAIGGTHLL